MAVYRTALDSLKGSVYTKSFFDTLMACFNAICKEGMLGSVTLAPDINPSGKDECGYGRVDRHKYERDILVMRGDVPLLSVFLQYRCSGGPKNIPGGEEDYVPAASYAGSVSLTEIQQSLGERLRAAAPVSPPEETPKPSFEEGRWTMVLRVPNLEPIIFVGSPMDIDALDRAFSVMVDQFVARIPK